MKDEIDGDCDTLISPKFCPAWLGWGVFCFSNLCFLFAFLIPLFNGYRYVTTKQKLKSSPPPVEKPYTCNGRANNVRGSDVTLEHLSTFWEVDEKGNPVLNRNVNDPQYFEGETPWTMSKDHDGDLVVSTGIRRTDINTVPDLTKAAKVLPYAGRDSGKETEQREGLKTPQRPSATSSFFG